MSDDLAQLSEPMTLMRTKDVKHLADRIEELEAKLAIAWDTQTVKILIKTAYREGWADGGDNVPLGSGWEKSRTKATLADLTGGEKDGN